jgi:hypothetical protein
MIAEPRPGAGRINVAKCLTMPRVNSLYRLQPLGPELNRIYTRDEMLPKSCFSMRACIVAQRGTREFWMESDASTAAL